MTNQISLCLGQRLVAILFAAFAILAVVLGSWSCSKKIQSITIGRPVSDSGALIFTADSQRFFEANGTEVTQKDYDTGLVAIDALLRKEIDFSGGGEFPLAVKALERTPISIVGSYARSFNTYLVARLDKGIKDETALRGKRVGLPRKTIPEFYLGRFLDLHGMKIGDVTLTDLTPKQAAGALADGAVDAVVVWEPYVSQINSRLANRIVSWSVHSGQAQYSILVCRNDWIRQNPELIERILKSLVQAEEYVARHPAETKAILAERYRHDGAYVARVWPEYQFSLSLDQSLITALEDEARWMIKNNLTAGRHVPNFLEYIYEDGLKAVKPEAVNIIR